MNGRVERAFANFRICGNFTFEMATWWSLFAALALLAAAAQGQREQSLNSKVQQLLEMTLRKGLIRLNGEKFRQYVKTFPRNYSMVVMLTAQRPERQCQVCQPALNEYTIVANSWRYSPHYNSRLFFGLVDYDEGSDIFQQLDISTAPVFLHFPAKGKPKPGDKMDIQRIGYAAEQIARWIGERTDIHIRIFRPPNYSGTLILGLTALFVGMLIYFRRDSLEFLLNKNMWAIITLAVIFCFTSGQMWNHIRGPPFVHRNPRSGEVSYIHRGNGYQLIAETYIVFIMQAAVVAGFIMLNEGTDHKADLSRRKFFSIFGVGLFCVFFSLILSVFRAKYQGYPYSFLFK